MKIFLLILSIFSLQAFADSISFEQIYSNAAPKGGIPCLDLGKENAYAENPVTVCSTNLQYLVKEKQMVLPACTQGGGDCNCHVLYYKQEKEFFEIRDKNGKPVWVKANEGKSMLTMGVEAISGLIDFKNKDLPLFTDDKFKNKISTGDIFKGVSRAAIIINISIPGVDQPAADASIQFWRSTEPDGVPAEMGGPELRKAFGEKIEFNVLEEKDEKFLVSYSMNDMNTKIAAYANVVDSPAFSWIKIKNLKFQKLIVDSPLPTGFLQNTAVYISTKKFNGKDYSHFQVQQIQADPKKPVSESNPEEFSNKIIKLREIWIPTYDDKGVINFWLYPPSC